MTLWRDGELVAADGAVSADDRGWLVGDSVFETMLVDGGAPAFLDRHLARMELGCSVLGIVRNLDADELRAAIATLARNKALPGRAVCRLTLSRSGGPRGLAPHPSAQPRLYVSLVPAAAPPPHLHLVVSNRRRWTGASTNDFKCSGAYAENVLARADAVSRGAGEAIMLNEHGRVACASSANLFVSAGAYVLTPALNEGAMPGVVRSILLEEAAALRIECQEVRMSQSDLRRGEILLTNSVAGVVRSALDGLPPPESGETAARLIAAYARRLANEFSARSGGLA